MRVSKISAAIAAVAMVACQQAAEPPHFRPQPRSATPAALFSNGDFETGTLNNWTIQRYINPGITYPPASLTDLNLVENGAGSVALTYARTGATASQIAAGMSATSTLRWPRYGTWSASVNEVGANQNANSIKQQMATTSADADPNDNKIHIRMVLAPVLQNPGHANTQQPYYYINVRNVTKNTTLFSRFNYVSQAGVPWQSDSANTILYTDWQAVDVVPGAAALVVGDVVEAEVIASGCSLGGHWGEVYVDAFGASVPGLWVTAKAPQSANAGTNITTTYTVSNAAAAAAGNVTVKLPNPTNTTFVSFTAPPGATCTTPAVGAAGVVNCNLGAMNPNASVSFPVVWLITAGATGSADNGSYTVQSDTSAPLIGPLASTAITSGASYADLVVTVDDGTAAVGWGGTTVYTIVVKNNGPFALTNLKPATVTDTLPAQMTGGNWTCAASAGSSCKTASGTGALSVGVVLASGGTATFVYNVSIIAGSGTALATNVVALTMPNNAVDPDTTTNSAGDTDSIGTLDTITLQKDAAGNGQGTVVSSPASINCGPACASQAATFTDGVQLSLNATAAPGYVFAGWSGPCSGLSLQCTFTPAGNTTVTAKFNLPSYNITASAPAGNGNLSCVSPVFQGQSSICTIAPAAGYALSLLTDNAVNVTALVSGGNYTISSVAADHAVVATFLKAQGNSCGAAGECANGICTDGVCCNAACGGQCQACDVPGSVGACVAVSGAPHAGRAACASDGSSCGGACDGSNVNACALPGASTSCRGASCSAGTQTAAASCNGTGSCPAPVTASCNAYICGPTACKTSCAGDGDCIAGDWCSAGACVPKSGNGGVCTANNQCGSGACTDGVCCNVACGGQCQACNAAGSVGTCKAVAGAPRGGRPACASDGSSCGGACDGSNGASCAYPVTSCRGASCAGGTATLAASCNGAGSCPAVQTQACNPYICGATACKTSCAGDGDCIAADWCSAGACVPKAGNGVACTANNQCGSGACTDGVCCSSACGGQCQACNVAGSVGSCVAVSGAPHGGRPACASDGSSCGGACDGSNVNACALPGASTSCGAASCSAGTQTAAASCNGTGSCPAPVTASCNPYICGATACKTSCVADGDCIAGDWCSAGACVPKSGNGGACTASNECGSGACADGVCCNVACGGQCQACNAAGSVGTCKAVAGAPTGGRPACTTDGSSCGGACDGTNGASCAYPVSSCRGASCAGGTATLAASCNGAGSCPAVQTQACNPYICGATACKTSCSGDGDCIAADWCSGGTCVPKAGNGGSCTADDQCGSGACADGVCCNSACGGQCQACNVAGSVGSCVAVSGAPVGGRPACASDGSSCGGACDGSTGASCAYPVSSCRGASCSAGVATSAASCDGSGSCPAPSTQSCGNYVCGPSACLTSCVTDPDCGPSAFCNSGVCTPKPGNGGACTAAGQCQSGNCIDGVCCDTACNGQCQACDAAGSVGTCITVAGAPHGSRTACVSDGSACGGACDGANASACAYPSTACRGASCASGTATLAASCDSAGHCPQLQQQACAPYICGAAACMGNCASDSDCQSGEWCSGGVCVPKLGDGASCAAGDQCGSGHCIEGLCCNTACDGQCEACDAAGSAGTCTAVTGAPRGARPACASDGSACGGACDGAHARSCAYPASQCRAASCAGGSATLAASCDGAGNCPAAQGVDCAPYTCGANACRGDCAVDTDCAAGNFCAAGVCAPLLADGVSCGGAVQCASGFCVDGLCCNTACDGQCQACDVTGSAGQCTPVAGAPHGARQTCASDGTACGGACDGANFASCAYPTSACRGASCGAGVATLAAACDGAGHCPAVQAQSCAPYLCGGSACLGNCSSDADCQVGDYCSAGICVRKHGNGSSCGAADQCDSGVCADGVCCNQACNGQCEACDEPGSVGACVAVAGEPRGPRLACTGDGSACVGACDGSTSGACSYPGSATQCRGASCSAGVATLAASCDGSGRCPAPNQEACNAYVCGPNACKSGCASDADCATGNYCLAGSCTASGDHGLWMVAGTGGCSSGGAAAGWPLLLVLLAFAGRKRRAVAAAALALCATAARADGVSTSFAVDRFQPGAGAFDVLGVWSPETAPHLEWHASAFATYSRDPLRLIAVGQPDQVRLLRDQTLLHLGASVGIGNLFEVGAVLPMAVAQGSSPAQMLGGPLSSPIASAGLGDLRVVPKLQLVPSGPFILGFAFPFSLPTGRTDSFLGQGGLSASPALLGELRLERVRFVANAGLALRGARELTNLTVGTALTYGAGAELPFKLGPASMEAQATLVGECGLSRGGSVERPLELLAALRWDVARGIALTAGGGPGLTDGYGTPRFRLFFSFSIAPAMMTRRRAPPLTVPPRLVEEPMPPPITFASAELPPVTSWTVETTIEPVLVKLEDARIELLAPVLFQKDRDVLLPISRGVLDAAVALLQAHREIRRVRIDGHTDGVGGEKHNMILSKQRARAVQRYLVAHKVETARLDWQGYGASKPVDSNKTAQGRARNRRVELIILERTGWLASGH